MSVEITPLRSLDSVQLERCASLLVECFAENWPEAWPTIEEARDEVKTFFQIEERFAAFAAVEGETVVGWIGGISEYDGNVVELHPIVVDPLRQGEGIGRFLVERLEEAAQEHGAYTMRVGTDDESGMTTLSNTDLYDDLPHKIASIQNLRRHPFEFYQNLGYSIIGVIPDANGPGKPDILMAKRLR
jgi:aminoglycoside 6'-N-acetyltransferase I